MDTLLFYSEEVPDMQGSCEYYHCNVKSTSYLMSFSHNLEYVTKISLVEWVISKITQLKNQSIDEWKNIGTVGSLEKRKQ